jgi:hypothetical protein
MTGTRIRCVASDMRQIATPDRGLFETRPLGVQPHSIPMTSPGAADVTSLPRVSSLNLVQKWITHTNRRSLVLSLHVLQVLSTYFALLRIHSLVSTQPELQIPKPVCSFVFGPISIRGPKPESHWENAFQHSSCFSHFIIRVSLLPRNLRGR